MPGFDRDQIALKTKREPAWVHFGAGNIFRAFPAAILQKLLDAGIYDKGLIVAEGFDYDLIDEIYRPYDNLCLLVTLKSDSTIEKRVIGSIVESLKADPGKHNDWKRLEDIFKAPSLQMASLTITEKGYDAQNSSGIIPKIVRLLYSRFLNGAAPLALVSMDNCVHNGERLYNAVRTAAEHMMQAGEATMEFIRYINDDSHVSFPWSMIDKITPRPDDAVGRMLKASGYDDVEVVVTGKNTYASSYVNAEETQYLVIEDAFPNGRPPLESGGILFTDRDTVNRVEAMKVCTCLNPLHTALAIFGCLLGYRSIHDEMGDPDLKRMIERLGFLEGLPVVQDPGIIDSEAFLREVLEVRLPNPFLPDTPQRIAMDTSQKLPIRFGQTIKAYLSSEDLDVQSLVIIPLVFAGWCRYLMGIDDEGREFAPSPDPLLEESRRHIAGFQLGERARLDLSNLRPLLSNPDIFGVDLYQAGLGGRVEDYFSKMLSGKGAVRSTIRELLEI